MGKNSIDHHAIEHGSLALLNGPLHSRNVSPLITGERRRRERRRLDSQILYKFYNRAGRPSHKHPPIFAPSKGVVVFDLQRGVHYH